MQLTAGRNGFNSFDKGLVTNPDGSTDVWFGPKLSDGAPEANWGQTIPGKGGTCLSASTAARTLVRQDVACG